MKPGQQRTAVAMGLLGLMWLLWPTEDVSVNLSTITGEPIRQTLCYDAVTNEFFDCDDPTYRVPAT